MEKGDFITHFHQKGRLTPLLEQVPIKIILEPQVGLLGSVLYNGQWTMDN